MELIAHRGAAYEAPENSLAAIDLAVRQGATRIEIDAWLTADGQVVICHDDTTKRCTDRDLVVASSTAAELAAAKMTNGEGIPTLHQVCELLAGRARLDLELKDQRTELVAPALAVLADHGMLADSLITAFGEASRRPRPPHRLREPRAPPACLRGLALRGHRAHWRLVTRHPSSPRPPAPPQGAPSAWPRALPLDEHEG